MALTQARLKKPLLLLVLAVTLFLIYANGLNTPFQSDDERHIFLNLEIDNPSYYLNPEKITYRQISLLVFALNYKWGQENPFGCLLYTSDAADD